MNAPSRCRPRQSRVRRCRGFALVIVLGLVAITLGLSYTLLRSQSFDVQLQSNSGRSQNARSAAQAGIATALRKMHDGTWGGADTNFTGSTDTTGLQGFVVSYATGDDRLTSSSTDWKEYPYRITIVSKGYAIDPLTSASRADYTIKVVVQLVRKQRATSAVTRTDLASYSFYQTSSDKVIMHYPVRINGDLHLQGELQFSRQYPRAYNGTEYFQLWSDIRKMYDDQVGDYRPITGRIYTPMAPKSRQPAGKDFWNVIDAQFHVPSTNDPISTADAAPIPNNFATYQLYAKGKSYSVETLPIQKDAAGTYTNADYVLNAGTYTANMLSNPIGAFTFNQDRVAIPANTSIQGTVFSRLAGKKSDLIINGSNINLAGTVLPNLQGETTVCRLPSLVANDNIHIADGTSRQIDGFIICGNEFHLDPGSALSTLVVNGCVFSQTLFLEERTDWAQTDAAWSTAYTSWTTAPHSGLNKYFPGWLLNNRATSWGFYLTPRLIFNQTPSGVTNHLPDWTQPLYVPSAGDAGLLWDIVSWTEPGAG